MRPAATVPKTDPLAALHGDVLAAARRIDGRVARTDLVRLPWLDAPGREVWAKLECHQHTGSFKVRGALNALLAREARPVVTASAGNHALGVSAAAATVGVPCTVFVPSTASPLKVERLAGMGTAIKQVGRDLHDAAEHAIDEALATGARYLSAYGDGDVVAGQGTVGAEVVDQLGVLDLDAIVVPLGGGGLVGGIGAYLADASPRTRIVAAHPSIYNRRFARGELAEALERPVVRSVADGLGVQVTARERDYVPVAESVVDRVLDVDERSIRAAITALLQRESVLAEGAGAIGVAALLDDPDGLAVSGRVVVVVSGGNITAAHLSEALAVSVDDPALRTLLGLRGTRLSSELPRSAAPRAALAPAPVAAADTRSAAAVRDTIWRGVVERAREDVALLADDLEIHSAYAAGLGLASDEALHATACEMLEGARRTSELCDAVCEGDVRLPGRARTMLHQLATARQMLDWCSPSSDESVAVQFFDRAMRSGAVPYSRYGFPALQELELMLVDVLGYDPTRVGACVTSSGMAAFAVVEALLTRDVLEPGDTIAYAPYIYFEAAEHILGLRHVEHVFAPGYGAAELVETVERSNARVLFADPVANTGDMPALDLRALGRLARGGDWPSRWVVIDSTLVSGGFDPFTWFDRDRGPRVIAYESASKYLQLGSDMQMAGVVAADAELLPRLYRHRRNVGAVLYEGPTFRFPRYTRTDYVARMRLVSTNARLFADALAAALPAGVPLAINYPRDWQRLGWDYGGALVSVVFDDNGLNNRTLLEGLIERVLEEARQRGARLTKGVSFGFSTARLSASAAMAEDSDPFLRFSLGEDDREDVLALVAATAASVSRFLAEQSR